MQDFRNLKVWEKSHQMTLSVYQASQHFPKSEMFGLTSQLRRSAASVASNIAEGCGRGTDADFCRFLQMAMGSASEADYQIILARDLGYIDILIYNELSQQIAEVRRMLNALITRLKANS